MGERFENLAREIVGLCYMKNYLLDGPRELLSSKVLLAMQVALEMAYSAGRSGSDLPEPWEFAKRVVECVKTTYGRDLLA
jgi:hypothetical protein